MVHPQGLDRIDEEARSKGFGANLLPSLFSRLRSTQTDAVSPEKEPAQKSTRIPLIARPRQSTPMLGTPSPREHSSHTGRDRDSPGSLPADSPDSSPMFIQRVRSDPQPSKASARREFRRTLSSDNPFYVRPPARSLDRVRFGAEVIRPQQPRCVERSEEVASNDAAASSPFVDNLLVRTTYWPESTLSSGRNTPPQAAPSFSRVASDPSQPPSRRPSPPLGAWSGEQTPRRDIPTHQDATFRSFESAWSGEHTPDRRQPSINTTRVSGRTQVAGWVSQKGVAALGDVRPKKKSVRVKKV